jgi:cytochrome c peroxidase
VRNVSRVYVVLAMLVLTDVAAGCHREWYAQSVPAPSQLGVIPPKWELPQSIALARVDLGRELFLDKRLSKDSTVSCSTCHIPEYAFAEPRPVSHGIGGNARKRNTPSIINSAFLPALDWDGRAKSLEDQLRGVFAVAGDMGIELGAALENILGDSRLATMFWRAFKRAPDTDGLVTAIASFQRSLVLGDSRFDRFLFGGDSTVLSPAERRGWVLFSGPKTGCGGCHVVLQPDPRGIGFALFTDHRFHNLGVGYAIGRTADVGRYAITGNIRDWGAFKTPSLRNVALTAPDMHDGSLRTDVVAFYREGGMRNWNLDAVMIPRKLSASEESDLIAFMKALTSEALLREAAAGNESLAVRRAR